MRLALALLILASCASDPPPVPETPPLATPAPTPTPTPTPAPTPTATPTPALTHFEQENGALKLPHPIAFETGSAVLASGNDDALGVVKSYLDAKSDITLLRIEGHVDGDAPSGQELSEKRAMAVSRWLVGKGVACARLIPVGFGSSKPVAEASTPEGKAKNRRIAFVNAALRGRPIGGLPVDGGGKLAGDPCK